MLGPSSSSHTPNRMQKNWDATRVFLKRTWPRLTDFDLQQIDGEYDRLISKVKELYGGSANIMQEAGIKSKIQNFLNSLES